MKELSIEQKAKAYDIVRKKIALRFGSNIAEEFFSEFEEPEDEKIRKALINGVECCKASGWTNFGNNVDIDVVLAWLEKQGEKVEPIESFNSEFERQVSCLIASAINKEHEYNEGYVKWTANALLEYAKRELEKQAGQKSSWSEEDESNLDSAIYYIRREPYRESDVEPIVDWLRNLKDRVQPQPKQGWSERDEKLALSIEQIFNCASLLNIVPDKIEKVKSWLKNLKNRVQPEQEWSEEDANLLDNCISLIEDMPGTENEQNWLKSLKDKVQPQSQWKPSDEQIQALVYVFNHYIPNATDKIAWNALQTIELMLGQLLREE